MDNLTIFFSKRNIPLILRQMPTENAPIMSLENREEWEDEGLYVIYDDGTVENILDDKFLNRAYYQLVAQYESDKVPTFVNGAWNPDFLVDLETELGFEWDKTSFDLILGRWQRKTSGVYE